MTWIDTDIEWNWGMAAVYNDGRSVDKIKEPQSTSTNYTAGYSGGAKTSINRYLLRNSQLDFTDIEKEKQCGELLEYF